MRDKAVLIWNPIIHLTTETTNLPPPSCLAFNSWPQYFINLSPLEDLTLATLAMRPLLVYSGSNMSEELSEENYGSVVRAFVVCEEDNILKQGFQEWMIQNNPADEVKMIYGADHMVMFSKPNELCGILNDIAYKYCS